MKQTWLLGSETQLDRLTALGDPLLRVNEAIDWEKFRKPI
jgi:hypothetical protein